MTFLVVGRGPRDFTSALKPIFMPSLYAALAAAALALVSWGLWWWSSGPSSAPTSR